jgi:hypothetical protein
LDRREDEQAVDRGQLLNQSRATHDAEQRRALVHIDAEESRVLVVVSFLPLKIREKNIQSDEPNKNNYQS